MKITFSKVVKGVRYLKHYGWKEFIIRLQEKMEAENVPYEPWYEKHKVSDAVLKEQRRKAAGWKDAPLISVVVPLYCTKETFLREMISSVQAQSYHNWQLCLADASPKTAGVTDVERIVREIMETEPRIAYVHLEENLGIAENTNAAIDLAQGDWIAFLDHDDLLAPDALFEAVDLMRKGPQTLTGVEATCWGDIRKKGRTSFEMIYTDEDKVDMEGKVHFQPHLKPDINLDLLRSNNYITHFLLVKRSLLERVGKIRKEYDGAQDYDFILRCAEEAEAVGHVPRILYHWRSHKESTSENPFSKQYAVDAGKRAIEDHLKRSGTDGVVTATKDMGFYRVKYPVKGNPLVSIVIPNKDETETLQKCLDSIARSSYQNYEIIVVENNSCETTFDYYRSIAPKEEIKDGVHSFSGTMEQGQRLRIIVWEEGFNYSKINNFGISFAEGEYILLLNNDIELIGTEVLTELLGTCQRPEVGIVGAKLYYPDNTVQHAGIVVGIGGNARGIGQNMFGGLSRERSGYLHKASLAMDYSAVTAACLMVKKSVCREVGGLEERLTVAFNDVDFCLKVRQLGYLVVYQPQAECYHYESKSRGAEDSKEKTDRFQREIEYMRNHWIGVLKQGDPYYNPNFSSVYANYSLKDL
jgi:GT2 family glycosyltransferase